jgi:hypothetical protein
MERTENGNQTVEMSAEEFERYRQYQERVKEEEKLRREKEDREAYRQLVEETIERSRRDLARSSRILTVVKKRVMDNFQKAIEMKGDLFGLERLDQCSHTFTSATGNTRIIIGNYTIDNYLDTVNEGIELVRQAIQNLATDDNSRALVNTVLRLLSKDKKGNLKASRVIQLEKTAQESGNEMLIRGVQIIKEAYQPELSKSYIRMEIKEEKGGWKAVPLSITEAQE